jgi:hypothetical protein
MINMQKYWQAATDFRSSQKAAHLKGFEDLITVATGPDGLPQRQACDLLRQHNVTIGRVTSEAPAVNRRV